MAPVIFPPFNENHNPTFPHKERLKVFSERESVFSDFSINLISRGLKEFSASFYKHIEERTNNKKELS